MIRRQSSTCDRAWPPRTMKRGGCVPKGMSEMLTCRHVPGGRRGDPIPKSQGISESPVTTRWSGSGKPCDIGSALGAAALSRSSKAKQGVGAVPAKDHAPGNNPGRGRRPGLLLFCRGSCSPWSPSQALLLRSLCVVKRDYSRARRRCRRVTRLPLLRLPVVPLPSSST